MEQNPDILISSLKADNKELKAELKELKKRIDGLIHLVELQKEIIQTLRDEIATLKGQKPRPKIPPSNLEGPKSKDKESHEKSRGKYPRKKKTSLLQIHERIRIGLEYIPQGAQFKGHLKYTVQDIIFQPHNTVYERERWLLPDGSYMTGKLPPNVHGHYGPELIAYILHQYHACRVTEPLLLEQLRERGVLISSGQLSNILIQNKECFHEEKEDLLFVGINATGQIGVDDTGARHKGKNEYATVIRNEWFTCITTTESKSRENFLRLLQNGKHEYLINEDTMVYLMEIQASDWLPGYLSLHSGKKFTSEQEWKSFLVKRNITQEKEVKAVTEATIFANLIEYGIPRDLVIHGDDAGQFNAFVRSLCWIHEERHYRKVIPFNETMRKELEEIREQIWELYTDLKEYKKNPNQEAKAAIEAKFESIFTQKVTSPTLEKQLKKTYKKQKRLLKVLERPETPLHNNGSETDVREYVMKRKVSGGTRSDEGLLCRDTFLSLKKTCSKLEVNFMQYLKDRISGLYKIPRLTEIILSRIRKRVSV